MAFRVGILKHLAKVAASDVAQKIKPRLFKKLHYLVMDIFALWVFGKVKNTLSSIVIVSRCSSIGKSFILDASYLKFGDKFIPGRLVQLWYIVHKSITDGKHNGHDLMENLLVPRYRIPRMFYEFISIRSRSTSGFKDFT